MEANNKAASRGTPSPDQDCALDADGKLMDASQINFFNSPGDERPISGPGVTPSSPTPAAKQVPGRPQRNSNRSKYLQAIASEKLDSDEDIDTVPKPSQAAKRKKAQSDSDGDSEVTTNSGTKKKTGPKRLLKKGKTTVNNAVNQFLKKSGDIQVAPQAAPPPAVTTASGSQTHQHLSSSPSPTTALISLTPSTATNSASLSQTSSNDTEPANISVSISIDATGASNRKSSADVAPLFKRLKRREEDGTVVWDNKYECIVCS